MPDPISCVIEDTCLGFQCCVDIDLMITTVSQSVYLNIDPCNFMISLGFGAWYVDASLLTYQLNTERTYTLGNAIDVRYVNHNYLLLIRRLLETRVTKLSVIVVSLPLLRKSVIVA